MSVIKWGKPTIGYAAGDATAPATMFDNIVEGTTQLTTNPGTELTARIEGGEIIDRKRQAGDYQLVFEVYDTRETDGVPPLAGDASGVIIETKSVFLQPEDATLKGFCFKRASGFVEDLFDASTGHRWRYTFTAIKNAGNTLIDVWQGSASSDDSNG